jgi:hypothetical protein
MPEKQGVFCLSRLLCSTALALGRIQERTENQEEQGVNGQSEKSWQFAVGNWQKRIREWAAGKELAVCSWLLAKKGKRMGNRRFALSKYF